MIGTPARKTGRNRTGSNPDPGVEEDAAPGPATVAGDIISLHPTDGLFLRAEHLQAMQTYARELSLAVGIGSGAGVVYGFDVSLDETKKEPALNVMPGLAISPIGQPLRSTTTAVVSLARDDRPPIDENDGFWVIEVRHAAWNFGNENVYGNVCDEPCAGSGSAIQPWTGEGVTISLRADTMPGLHAVKVPRRRSWLASHYFERERRQGRPWVSAISDEPGAGSLLAQDWSGGIGEPLGSVVPIGVVQKIGGIWALDVWTARREIGGPPSDDAWRRRLAMRPWNVFLAQVLQFQDQLSSVWVDNGPDSEDVDPFHLQMIEKGIAGLRRVGKRDAENLMSSLRERMAQHALDAKRPSLLELGIDELPPAGYLPVGGDAVKGLFDGASVDLRTCNVSADYVPGAVEESQHLDRIPLDSEERAAVDILVPGGDYGWVAFVRRREIRCDSTPAALDRVAVFVHEAPQENFNPESEHFPDPKGDAVGQLSYPAGGWDFAGDQDSIATARKVAGKVKRDTQLAIVAFALDPEGRALGALRSSLLAAALDHGVAPPQVWSIVRKSDATPEAIGVYRLPG